MKMMIHLNHQLQKNHDVAVVTKDVDNHRKINNIRMFPAAHIYYFQFLPDFQLLLHYIYQQCIVDILVFVVIKLLLIIS